jgi:hypothetical protein
LALSPPVVEVGAAWTAKLKSKTAAKLKNPELVVTIAMYPSNQLKDRQLMGLDA